MYKAVSYYLALPFIYFFSLLPLSVLYLLSDVLIFPLLYYVVRYRQKVVLTNLSNAFPEKSERERVAISKKYFRFLSDLFMETVKVFTISQKQLLQRISYSPEPEIMKKWFKEGRSYVFTLGHYGNYEWLATSLDLKLSHKGTGPYREMHNPYFDRLFLNSRQRFGTMVYPTHQTMKELIKMKGETIVVALANDQAAPPDRSYWTKFLNQDTSFFVGTEKIARNFNMGVIFLKISRVKRGYYSVSYELIADDLSQIPEGEIMRKHAKLLEEQILEKPEYWLWSHRRWKYKKPDGLDSGFSPRPS
jgi:KDO2-lipid IV(A) lauroyltransferase